MFRVEADTAPTWVATRVPCTGASGAPPIPRDLCKFLPAVQRDAHGGGGRVGAMSDAGSVLVVDDDVAVGTVLQAMLRQGGYEARHVTSGADALAALEARPYDVVISDVRMPGMDGMALLGEVAKKWPEVPVVLLTAHGSVPLAVEAMKAGAGD